MSKFLKPIGTELYKAIVPLKTAFSDPKEMELLLVKTGWAASLDASQLASLSAAFGSIDTLIDEAKDLFDDLNNENGDELTQINDLVDTILAAFDAIIALQNIDPTGFPAPFDEEDLWTDWAAELGEYLLANYLQRYQPLTYGLLVLVGVIERIEVSPSTSDRVRYIRHEFNWERIKTFLTDPAQLLQEVYNWNHPTNSLDHEKLLSNIELLFVGLRMLARKNFPLNAPALDYYADEDELEEKGIKQLTIPVIAGNRTDNSGYLEIGVTLLPIPATPLSGDDPAGFFLGPVSRGEIGAEFTITPELKLITSGGFDLAGVFGATIYPNSTTLTLDPSSASIDAGLKLLGKPENPDEPWILLGAEEESRLELEGFQVGLEVQGTPTDFEYIISAGTGNASDSPRIRFVLMPGEGDSFIKKIIGNDEVTAEWSGLIQWSSKNGFGIQGQSGFTIKIPQHKKFGPVELDNVYLDIHPDAAGPQLRVGVDTKISLGPFTAVINNMGVKLTLTEKGVSDPSGILGNADIELDFKMPTGVGVSIDSPTVTGGGFLTYDDTTKTYAGGLEISFKKFSLQAFGIVSTQLPDGSEGYSLLIFITAQFQPIPIGMGFTLNGVGGMLGLNRSTNVEFLRAGVRDGSLQNFLFPGPGTSIVANASSLISTANQAFPIQEGRFVFGPLAKLGWGSPNILTIDLGIVIEVPDPVTLAILGVLKAILPDESKQTLKLQVNFLGLIDFDKKQLSFDATIYDSKLLNYALSGDMALRIAWGNQPNFLLSVGGFHPQFTPPPLNLPELRRIAVQIFNEENLRVRFETYFALTSNSAQFGAKLDAYAAAGKFNATALLWFDVLFQFSPFKMIAGMGVEVAIRRNDKVLFGAYLSVTVSGPGPWRVWGEVAFEFCKCNFSIHFDKTFGEGVIAENASVDVLPQIQAALDEPKNWTADLPERNNQLVALSEPTLDEGTLFVSPSGNLTFRQQGLPLDVLFSKFGNAKLHDYKKFSIINVRDANDVALAAGYITDFFAANEFYYLTDAEKLARPSYELYKSGVSITGTSTVRSSYAVHREFAYEQIEIDIRVRNTTTNPVAVNSDDFEAQLNNNTISQSPFAANNHVIPHNASPRVSVDERTFTLVSVDDMSPYNTVLTFTSETEAEQYLSNLVASNTNLLDQLIVVDQLELVA